MIVRVKSGKTNLVVPFSTSAALIAAKAALREEGTSLRLTPLFREILRAKRLHPDWVLAEVETADGTHVVVKL